MKIIEWFKRDPCVRGTNIPVPNKRPPMPTVKPPLENEKKAQIYTCVDCRYYLVDSLSDPCDECVGKAGFGYNRFIHKANEELKG